MDKGAVVVGMMGTIICVAISAMSLHTCLTATDIHPAWIMLGYFLALVAAPVFAISSLLIIKEGIHDQEEA